MKVFISQPMNGKSNEEIIKERENLVLELEKQGFEVIDNVLDLSDNKTPLHYLAKSIELLADADCVYFMKGFNKARGCLIEYNIARLYGKFIKEEI